MKTIPILFCLSLMMGFVQSTLFGQKEQVAFISGIFEIDQKLRAHEAVLEEYKEDFSRALLYRLDDGTYQLEVVYEKRGTIWRDVYPISSEDLALLREALSTEGVPRLAVVREEKSGRAYLITSTTLHSITQGIYLGSLFSKTVTYFDSWSGTSYSYQERTPFGVAFPFISVAGHFAGSLLLTSKKEIPLAAANGHFWGSSMGYLHGIMLYEMINYENDYNYTASMLSMASGSLIEGWVTYHLAKKNDWSYSTSMAYISGNYWGFGLGQGVALGVTGDYSRINIAAGLLGSGLGMYGARQLHKSMPRSSGDYRAINMAGTIGMTWVPVFAERASSARGIALSYMSAGILSLTAGHYLTANTNFSKMEGGLIALGSFAGGMLGAGMALAFDVDSPSAAFSFIASGATLAWVGTYLYFVNSNKQIGRSIGFLKSKESDKVTFRLNPAGVAMSRGSARQQQSLLQMNGNMSWMTLSYDIR